MVELGGCDWVWLVYLLVRDRPTVQNQRHKPKTRQVAQRVKVEGGVALTGRMWWNLVVVTGPC